MTAKYKWKLITIVAALIAISAAYYFLQKMNKRKAKKEAMKATKQEALSYGSNY